MCEAALGLHLGTASSCLASDTRADHAEAACAACPGDMLRCGDSRPQSQPHSGPVQGKDPGPAALEGQDPTWIPRTRMGLGSEPGAFRS